jgi:Flp pilus assembly protein TadG
MLTPQHETKNAHGARWQRRAARPRRRGAAVVELAVTSPLLILLAFGVVEYAQLMHAGQVVSNASRRGARLAARNETTSVAAVQNYVTNFVKDSFPNMSSGEGGSPVSVSVLDSSGVSIASGDLSGTASGTPVTVNVSFDFESIRVLNYFSMLNDKTLQMTTVSRRE